MIVFHLKEEQFIDKIDDKNLIDSRNIMITFGNYQFILYQDLLVGVKECCTRLHLICSRAPIYYLFAS